MIQLRLKPLLLFIVIILGVSLVWWGVTFILSYKSVTLNLVGKYYSVQISDMKTGKEVSTVEATKTIRLRAGTYVYSAISKNHERSSTSFSVDNDTKLTIRPEYKRSYLYESALRERPNILNTISDAYPGAGQLAINTLTINSTGEWAYGSLIRASNSTEKYRFIMKKDQDKWIVVVKPTIAISLQDSKDIPKEILYDLYEVL